MDEVAPKSGAGQTTSDAMPNVLSQCTRVIDSVGLKADKNKRRARWSATSLTALTAGIPVSLILAEWFHTDSFCAFLFGRLVPGLAAAAPAILSRWMQFEQPHQRWTLFRHWQRFFEAERLRYEHRIGRYASGNRDATLAEILAAGQIELDDQWASLVPRSRELTHEDQNQ